MATAGPLPVRPVGSGALIYTLWEFISGSSDWWIMTSRRELLQPEKLTYLELFIYILTLIRIITHFSVTCFHSQITRWFTDFICLFWFPHSLSGMCPSFSNKWSNSAVIFFFFCRSLQSSPSRHVAATLAYSRWAWSVKTDQRVT